MRDITFPLPAVRAVLNPLYRAIFNKRLPWRAQRLLLDLSSRTQPVPSGTNVARIQLGGRPTELVTNTGTSSQGVLLYLHGGGYVVGSPRTHRALTARLAKEIGCAVYALDYRLAPEHPYPAALDDAEAAFLELIDKTGYPADQIAIAGDSAGGGLALALAQRLIERHKHTPAALGLIAPWVDPNQVPEHDRDLVINAPWSRQCAAAYLGDQDSTDPGYAPLTGTLHGLPPTYVQVDVSELLHPQCTELVERLRAAGVHARFSETRGLWHVAQVQAGLAAAAAAAATELAEFLAEAIQPVRMRDLG